LSSLDKNYGLSIKNSNLKYFNILHRSSPVLKILSLLLALISLFKGWAVFFAALGVFILSMVINHLKWQFNFSFDYILYSNNLKVVKTVNAFKFKELFKIDLTKVTACEQIALENVPQKDVRVGVGKDMHLEFILRLKVKGEQDAIITADKYLYSKIVEIMEQEAETATGKKGKR
jgi:hypothetical protein